MLFTPSVYQLQRSLLVVDGHRNFDTGFNGNVGDLLDHFRRGMQVDDTLVDAHFESIPSVGTFSRRSLTGGDAQTLGGHTDRSGHVQFLVGGALLEVGTHLFQVGDIAGSQRDANTVNHLILRRCGILLDGGNVRHVVFCKEMKRVQKEGESDEYSTTNGLQTAGKRGENRARGQM